MQFRLISGLVATSVLATLLACGSSSSNQQGLLNVSVTDAPVDGATEVVVKFDGVEIKPKSGSSFSIDFTESKTIDLLALQNGTTAPLLQDLSLDAGEYNWLRLKVDADQGELDSYISFDDGSTFSLYIPSGNTTGLKLNRGFTIAAGATANFTLDFDLRKSVHLPGNGSDDYFLRPTIRILDNTEVGQINGTIDPSLVNDASCEQGLAVYAYSGAQSTVDDEGSMNAPISSAMPVYDGNNDNYQFTLSYLLAGDYTVAVTCDADIDDPEIDDVNWTSVVQMDATVVVNQTTSIQFQTSAQ